MAGRLNIPNIHRQRELSKRWGTNKGGLSFHVLALPGTTGQNAGSAFAKATADQMAGVAGLEPVTSAVTGQRSNQLSYTPALTGKEYPIRRRQ